MNTSRHHIQNLLPFVIIMAGAYLLYMQVFSGVWLMDDFKVLVDNPDIRSLSNFFEDTYRGRPLRELTYLVDYRFFGLEPSGYYIQNIFWHGLSAWLIFLLAKRLQSSLQVAWFSALLFLAHPIHVEVVANTSHRKDSLALAFCMVSILFYLVGRDSSRSRQIKCLAVSALFWGVALSAKQNSLALPIVVVAYELFRVSPFHRLKVYLYASFAVVIGFAGRFFYLVNSQSFLTEVGPALRKLENAYGGTVDTYFQTVFKAWAFMFSKLFYPLALSMEYTFSVPRQWGDPWVLCGLLIAVFMVGLFVYLGRCSLIPYFSMAWFAAFWLPTSNIVGHFSYFAADRYWYAPSAGIFLLCSYGLWKLTREHCRSFILLALVPLSLLSWQTFQQQKIWTDAELFYQHMSKVSPEALAGFMGLGRVALKQGAYDDAVKHYQKALQRSPREGRVLQSLGFLAYKQGQYELAMNYFQRALVAMPQLIDTYNNLGSLYDDLGQSERAIEIFERGLEVNPHFEEIYTNLGVVYEKKGQLGKAEALHRKAVSERYDYGQAHYNLGNTLYHADRKLEAMQSFAMAIRYSPENADALYNYAVVANELGRKEVLPSTLAKLRAMDPQLAAELEEEL